MTTTKRHRPTRLLLLGIGQLVTNDPARDGPLGVIKNAAVLVSEGLIEWVGSKTALDAADDRLELDLDGKAVLPGLVDAHTHAVFAGDRSDEFGRRLRGESYEAIMAAGGGIQSTVAATRAASNDVLFEETSQRLDRMLAAGTTTVEVKSGYGLDVATEERMLLVARRIAEASPMDIASTFLGAHVAPNEFAADREGYVAPVEDEMLPACAPLARFCDVFCDESVFSLDETRPIVEAGKRYGLVPRIHADQPASSGGAGLAAELGVASADHLDHVTDAEIEAMAQSGTAAVWSDTRGGALLLEMPDRGWIGEGALADFAVLEADSYLHLPYRPDSDLIGDVIKDGRVVRGVL